MGLMFGVAIPRIVVSRKARCRRCERLTKVYSHFKGDLCEPCMKNEDDIRHLYQCAMARIHGGPKPYPVISNRTISWLDFYA